MLSLCLIVVVGTASCQDYHWPDSVQPETASPGRKLVQEGNVTLRDGEEARVHFKTPFAAPPRLVFLEFNQSWFKDLPYQKSDFQIIQLGPALFTVQNNHRERFYGAWASIHWRAEGTEANPAQVKRLMTGLTQREQIAAAVHRLGGQVVFDAHLPAAPVVTIDLHRTRTTDSDLVMLDGLTTLRALNLYGTHITDAGMAHVAGLTGLQTLQLNDTAITDAGLRYLRGLTHLSTLGLHHTHITDQGLSELAGLTGLVSLYLGDTAVTDAGLSPLRKLRSLKQLWLGGTHVTDAGVQELHRALPKTQILR